MSAASDSPILASVMTPATSITGGDSSDARKTPPPSIPMLSMLVDRTSFDETDDFGVDTSRLDEEYIAGPPVMMRDGRVRRRLRWRPKSMAKKRRPLPIRKLSSGSSVMSTSSKQSKKSLHSFASTETAAMGNTAKTKQYNKFPPLPRPSAKPVHGVSTIGNEGDFVQARIAQQHPDGNLKGSNATVFAAADVVEAVHPRTPNQRHQLQIQQREKVEEDHSSPGSNRGTPSRGITMTTPRKLIVTPSPSRRPPLFRPNTKPSGIKSATAVMNHTPETKRNSYIAQEDDRVPVPVLSGDDVEIDRRVDLRIRRSPSTMSTGQNCNSKMAILEDGVAPLSVTELRSVTSTIPMEERQDLEDENMPKLNFYPGRIFKNFKKRGRKNSEDLPTVFKLSPPDELRFSMSATFVSLSQTAANDISNLSAVSSDSFVGPKQHTGPVDVDDGHFLEAEKNLQAIHEVASEHLRQGEFAEALEVFEEILRGQLTRYGEGHYRVGTALHNIGIVHMKRGDYARAVTVYKEAVRVRKVSLDPDHPDVAVSLAQLGVAYMESNRHRKAIGAFREALKIRRKCLGNDHHKVAKILNNIGCSLFELDELEVAKVAFEEALEIQRNLLRNMKESEEGLSESSLLSIASTQSNIASIKLYCGQYDEACVGLEEALLIQQCVLGDDHPLVRRTLESLKWLEKSRDEAQFGIGTLGLLSSSQISVFDSLEEKLNRVYAGFDVACKGWDVSDEKDETDETVALTTDDQETQSVTSVE